MIGVYALLFQNDNVYIGSSAVSCEGRLTTHLSDLHKGNHCNAKMQACFNKYGDPEFQILEVCKNPKKVTTREQAWLDAQPSDVLINFGPALPNALFGKGLTDEHKRKLSLAQKGKKLRLGKRHSDKTKRKLSELAKGNKNMFGKKFSAETRKKMSLANIGKPAHNKGMPMSDEQKMKISQSMKLYWLS